MGSPSRRAVLFTGDGGGDVGLPGLKLLDTPGQPWPQILGGTEIDHPITNGSVVPPKDYPTAYPNLQDVGCPSPLASCTGLTPELALYNVTSLYFEGTPGADVFEPKSASKGPARPTCSPRGRRYSQ